MQLSLQNPGPKGFRTPSSRLGEGMKERVLVIFNPLLPFKTIRTKEDKHQESASGGNPGAEGRGEAAIPSP